LVAVIFRRAVTSDALGIHKPISSLAHHRAVDFSEPPPAGFVAGFSPDVLGRNLGDSCHAYLVAEADGTIIGVLGILDRVRINHLLVAESWQKKGVARNLSEITWRDGLLSGQGPIRVKSSLAAVPVYERLGSQPTGPVVQDPA
jgi:hypothetical protein